MLFGNASKKPSLELVRRIKLTLHEALDLPEEAIITVTQLACLEEDCEPLETVIGLHRPSAPQLQYKLNKATDLVGAEDLLLVCEAWGFEAKIKVIDSFSKERTQ